MLFDQNKYEQIKAELKPFNAEMVAVSKKKSVESIRSLYDHGHRVFGENYVQELSDKQQELPSDIQWHYIGHLQTNKVKPIAPFISLIQSADSFKLLQEINKKAKKNHGIIDCLLQIYIAMEDTKYGLSFTEAESILNSSQLIEMKNIRIRGFMGMASLTADENQIRKEFKSLRKFYDSINAGFQLLSMGMTGDYKIALEEGSNMVRIGSAIFGEREKTV